MNELELKIIEILKAEKIKDFINLQLVKVFISECSISDFEKLKDLEYDLNQKDNE